MTTIDNTGARTFTRLCAEVETARAGGMGHHFLYEYFTGNKRFNRQFVDFLVTKYPVPLIDAIRKSQTYLRSSKLKQLRYLETSASSYVSGYVKVFIRLASEEQRLYTEIKNQLLVLDQCNPVTVLNIVAFWFDSRRASISYRSIDGSPYDVTPEIETASFFLSHYLKGGFDEKELQNAASTSLVEYTLYALDSDFVNHPAWQILELAERYLYFLKGTIEIFSFDSNYELNLEGSTATLSFTDIKKREKWNEEEAKILFRYNAFKQRAEIRACEELGIYPGVAGQKINYILEREYLSLTKKYLSLAAAEDYCLLSSTLNGISSDILIDYFNNICLESTRNYAFGVDMLNSINPALWAEHIRVNMLELEATGEGGCPLVILGEETVRRARSYYKLDAPTAEKLVGLISNDIHSYSHVDRLNPPIDLLGKPFIKVGTVYIGIRPIISESVGHLSVLVNIMECNHEFHQKVEKAEAHTLEDAVMHLFISAGFKDCDCSVEINEDGITKGEFDLLIYEEGILLVAEIKRSKPRVLPSDVNNELINSVNKASRQLDERLAYIKWNFEDFKKKCGSKLNIEANEAKDILIVPFILSTSIEQDHVMIEGKHLKVSLFEIRERLNVFRQQRDNNNLEIFIKSIRNNDFWNGCNLQYELPNADDRLLKFDV